MKGPSVELVKYSYCAVLVVLCRIHQDGVNIVTHECLVFASNIMKKMFCDSTPHLWKGMSLSAYKTSWVAGKAYIPGTGDTMINKVVPPGQGLSIALRLGWPLLLPQMWTTQVHNKKKNFLEKRNLQQMIVG